MKPPRQPGRKQPTSPSRGGPPVYGKTAPAATIASVQTWEGEVSGLGGLGDAIVRRNGEVVLVAGGVPGDLLRLRDLGRRAGVRRAALEAVLRPSPARRAPPCPVATRCGGCTWQHVSDELQQSTRRSIVARAVGCNEAAVTVRAAPALGYRRRARLHLRTQTGGLSIGFLAENSDDLVAIQGCPVLEPALNALLPRLRKALAPYVDRGELTLLAGVQGPGESAPVVLGHLTARPRRDAVLRGALANALLEQTGLDGLLLQLGTLQQQAGLQEVVLPETGEQLPIRGTANGFVQASAAGNTAIRGALQEALTAIAARRVAAGEAAPAGAGEWFAGSGNLTAMLAGHVRQLEVVEWDFAATKRLTAALAPAVAAGLQLRVHTADAAEIMPLPDASWLAVLDPGRPGALALCEHWARLPTDQRPRDIVYVSCAADTLQRDVRVLRAAGWQVEQTTLVDTYAQTPRVEVVTWLHRP